MVALEEDTEVTEAMEVTEDMEVTEAMEVSEADGGAVREAVGADKNQDGK